MSRIPRPIIANVTYFITSVTCQRQKCFANPQFAQIVVEQWKYYEKSYRFHLDAYSLLPDHYHVVLGTGEEKTISQNREGEEFLLDLFSRYKRWSE